MNRKSETDEDRASVGVAWATVEAVELRARHYRDSMAKVLAFVEASPASKVTAQLGDDDAITAVHFAVRSHQDIRMTLELEMCLSIASEAPVRATVYRMGQHRDAHWEFSDVGQALSKLQAELTCNQTHIVPS